MHWGEQNPFSKVKFPSWAGVLLALVISTAVFATAQNAAESAAGGSHGLESAVILIIRHAEKPDHGGGLSPAGEARARAYVNYFQKLTVGSESLKLDDLVAAADSKASRRSRLTLEPLGQALGLPIDCRFKNKQFLELAREIQTGPPGKSILICWHHGEIPRLLRALGADPQKLLPNAKWPDKVYGWLIQLRYDANGRLVGSQRINENLLPDEAVKPAPAAP